MFVDSADRSLAAQRVLLVTFSACASTLWFFRFQIADGFAHAFGDRYDAMIEVAILQHWANVFAGREAWSLTQYFYPAVRTLGYNDGYLVSGILFAIARACGASLIAAAEITHAVYKLAGFVGMYLLLRRRGHSTMGWALFGATLLTIADLTQQHTNHGQLFTVAFAPYAALLGWNAIEALLAGRRGRLLRNGIGFVLLFAAWLSTAFYLAWFCALFCLILAIVAGVGIGRTQRRHVWRALVEQRHALFAIIAVGLFALLPFAYVYLAKASETGMHPYVNVEHSTLNIVEFVYPGQSNVVWGPVFEWLRRTVMPRLSANPDDVFGLPPLLFGVTLFAAWAARRGRLTLPLAWIGIAILIAWLLMLRLWPESLWRIVYALVPGAKAIRVVGRFQILLLVPVILLATIWLSRWPRKTAALVLGALLLVEQTSATGRNNLSWREQQAMLAGIATPPAACRSFYVRASRVQPPLSAAGAATDGVYAHNVDAMVIAEVFALPTINGLSTFNPPFWDFADPLNNDYDYRVGLYAQRFSLSGLCRLDVRETPAWRVVVP